MGGGVHDDLMLQARLATVRVRVRVRARVRVRVRVQVRARVRLGVHDDPVLQAP